MGEPASVRHLYTREDRRKERTRAPPNFWEGAQVAQLVKHLWMG